MNNNRKTYFTNPDIYQEEFCDIFEYNSAERRDLAEILDILWDDSRGMKQWKLDVLYCYLCHKDQDIHRLPPVSLYNYMF